MTTPPSATPLSADKLRERLGGVSSPEMNGDNLAITLCSHFDDPDDEDGADDSGWSTAAVNGCNSTLDAIHALYLATLTAREEIIAGLTGERDAAQAEAACAGGDSDNFKARAETAEVKLKDTLTRERSLKGERDVANALATEWFNKATSARSRITVLEEALRPFAKERDRYPPPASFRPVDRPLHSGDLKLSDLDRAAASLSPPTQVTEKEGA